MGNDLDGRVSLYASQRHDAGEEILIRETRRESEKVRIHGMYVSR